jgi:nucleotide-binding universal stress UspA family protein
MQENKKIVVLVDFLDNTETIVNYAASIAEQTAAVTHFIHVVDVYKDDPLLDNIFVQRCEDKLIARAKSRMAQLLSEAVKKDQDCTGEVVAGKPIDKIVELARRSHSDLIMIGPNGL